MAPLSRPARLRFLAAFILLGGLALSALLYARAQDAPAGNAGYVLEGGQAFEVRPEDSRSYQRSLEYFGGKSAVLMTELREALAALFSGRPAALLAALAAVAGAGWCLHAAGEAPRTPPPQDPDSPPQ